MKIGFTYMLLVLPTFKIKVGQTAHLLKRRSDISDSLPWQIAVPIMVIFSTDYIDIEKRIHDKFDFCRYEYRGSGKSEYFRTIVSPLIWVYMVAIQIAKIIKTLTYIAAFCFLFWVVLQIVTG